MDSIVTDYLENGTSQARANAEHLDAQAISIPIQGTRIMGRYEEVIREHIDGFYYRHYLSAKHNWTNSSWACIDWPPESSQRGISFPADQVHP